MQPCFLCCSSPALSPPAPTRCGEPANRETKSVEDTTAVNGGANQLTTVGTSASLVEYWTYNFGPQSFVRKLKFVDGRLAVINTGGYGY